MTPSSAGVGGLLSARGRQRNSVAVVDCRDHIYEELEFARGPPKLTPISGVLPQVNIFLSFLGCDIAFLHFSYSWAVTLQISCPNASIFFLTSDMIDILCFLFKFHLK